MTINPAATAAGYMQAAQTATQGTAQATSTTNGQTSQQEVRQVARQQAAAQQVAAKDMEKASTASEESHDSTPNDDGTGRALNARA